MAKKTSIKKIIEKVDARLIRLKRSEFYRIDFPAEGEAFNINEALAYEISPNWAITLTTQVIHLTKIAIVSLVLFFLFFLIFNAPAYYQILENDVLNITNNVKESYLTHLEEQEKEPPKQELIVMSKDPVTQKQEFPSLSLEVTSPDNRIIIPSINKNIPIVEIASEDIIGSDWTNLNNQILEGLKSGVVRYPGTAKPGEEGNVFITGHSSYYLWDDGQYKDVFALLSEVNVDDQIIIYYDQQKYVYKITEKKEVEPAEVNVLEQPVGEERLTLMTCTPVGTNLKRLILIGEIVAYN